MFKRYTKGLLEKEVMPFSPITKIEDPLTNEPLPFALPKQEEYLEQDPFIPMEEPETIIGENVTIKGELTFDKLLRIDGTFEGTLKSQGRLIIGPKGNVKTNISLEEAFISGKVEGDITVKDRLVLRGSAEVYGNITAQRISVDEGVTIVGQLCVTPQKPPIEQS